MLVIAADRRGRAGVMAAVASYGCRKREDQGNNHQYRSDSLWPIHASFALVLAERLWHTIMTDAMGRNPLGVGP